MTFDVIPQNLSISAMRSSGYRDTAHAIAELIDNAIQSGQETPDPTTQVELICVDRAATPGGRKRLFSIAVFDSAKGMNPETLRSALQFGNGTHLSGTTKKGIGKFGMGLPNSSISQCRRVDVWSWQGGKVHHSHLDVTQIEQGLLKEVPKPTVTTIPSDWLKMIASEIRDHGTLVVWSELDRVAWKQSATLLRNTEFITGRIYRRFIDNGSVRIRLAAYEDSGGRFARSLESFVRPNDPLYLMKDTNSPPPYEKEPAFEPYGEEIIVVGFKDEEHRVKITASICKPETRRGGGSRPIGQHAKKNIGISVVRADRELELNRSFENSYDPRERWWGVEVDFDPALDDVFGVTNNKQAATGFMRQDLDEDAESEGMTPLEYQNLLLQDEDPRMPMYLISRAIDKLITSMRLKVIKMREGERIEQNKDTFETRAERLATKSVRRRRRRIGDTGESDRQEEQPDSERTEALAGAFEIEGLGKAKAKEIAVKYVKKEIKFHFQHGDVPNAAFFEVSPVGGVILITLNTRSPVHRVLFHEMQEEDGLKDPHLKDVLSLLAAWARMEDEAQSKILLQAMQDLRQTWGRVAMDFFDDEQP